MLSIDLQGKKALIAGIGDDKGFGWAIAKALAEAGATVIAAIWPPLYSLFVKAWEQGRFDESRRLSDGSLFEFAALYPLDASFDTMDDIPQEIRENKRYACHDDYALKEMCQRLIAEFDSIDIVIHSMANAPEVKKPLLETSRQGYLAAMSASTYSFIGLLARLGPHMGKEGCALCLSFLAAERAFEDYGGGMGAAKAALECDTRYLAAEAGRRWGIRVNCISAGPWASRAAKAIGAIDKMIEYYSVAAPLQRPIDAEDVALSALFLCSSWARSITAETLHVDCGYHAIGLVSSPSRPDNDKSDKAHVKETA